MPARKKLVVTRERLLNKVDECRYFLQHMDQHENNVNEFGFSLSAFLSAFKSLAHLTPLIAPDPRRQKQLRNGIDQLRDGHPDLNYLLNARDAEVHREGVRIVMTLSSFLTPGQRGFTFRKSRFTGRQFPCTAIAGSFGTIQDLSSMSAGIVSSF